MPPDDNGARVAFDSDGNIVAAGNGMEGSPPEPGNLIVWDADTYAVLRRDERPFARHLAVAALPGGRVLTGDRYALRLWTPRQPGADASEPPATANRDKSPGQPARADPASRPTGLETGRSEWRRCSARRPAGPACRSPTPRRRNTGSTWRSSSSEKTASYAFALGFVVDGRQTEIVIDQVVEPNGKCTGLHGLDGVPLTLSPKSHRGQLLFPSRPVRALADRPAPFDQPDLRRLQRAWTGTVTRSGSSARFRWPLDPKLLFLGFESTR